MYHGWVPLHFGASLGSYWGADWLLIKCNATVDNKTKLGETSLVKACVAGHLDIVLLLMKSNADVYAICELNGLSIFHFAALTH